MGMTDAETLAILMNAAQRWGKFVTHSDPQKQLISIINYCRVKYPKKEQKEAEPSIKVFTLDEFEKSEIKIEWVVPNLLHKNGVLVLVGPSGVGKSQISLRFAEKIIKKDPFLNWLPPAEDQRILFVSMEMEHSELRFFTDKMKLDGEPEFKRNFLLWPIGSSIGLTSRKGQIALDEVIDKYRPTGIMLDSLGKGAGDDINSERVIAKIFDFIDKLRNHYGIFTWFVHHPRKSQVGNRKPTAQDDIFGSAYILNNSSTVVGMYPSTEDIILKCTKLRLAPKFPTFKIRRNPDLDFKLVKEIGVNRNKPILGSSLEDLI